MDLAGDVVRKKGPDGSVLFILVVVGLLCGAFVVLSLLYGFDSDDTIKLAAASLIFLAASVGVWGESRSRLVLYENGVEKRSFRGTVSLAFDAVTSIAIDRRSSKDSFNRDLITGKQDLQTTLTLSDGTKRIEFGSGSFGEDTELESVADRVTEIVAAKLIETLDTTGTLPLIPNVEFSTGKITGSLSADVTRPQGGVAPPPVSIDSKILLLDAEDMSVSVRLRSGWVYLEQDDSTLGLISSATPNLFPVLEVLAMRTNWNVLGVQSENAVTQSEPPERFTAG